MQAEKRDELLTKLRADFPFGRRELAVGASLLLGGLLIGLLTARVIASPSPIGQSDYAVLVAELYERERSITNAQDRLEAVGLSEAGEQLAAWADARPLDSPGGLQEAQSLRQLAIALGAPAPAVVELPSTVAPSEEEGGGLGLLLIPLLVFILALGLGTLFAIRVLGVDLSSLQKRDRPASRLFGNGYARMGRRPPPPQRGSPVVIRRNAILEGRTGPLRTAGRGTSAAHRPYVSEAPPQSLSQFSFQSTYQAGDDPYDEIHPIVDRVSGVLMGACGLSAALSLDDSTPGHYYAFTAWVHDYISNEQLKAVGLVSRWAYSSAGEEIDTWLKGGLVDEVKRVDQGVFVHLETSKLSARLSVASFTYVAEEPAESCFDHLSTRFDVTLKSESSLDSFADDI